jgi:hypothetical protein
MCDLTYQNPHLQLASYPSGVLNPEPEAALPSRLSESALERLKHLAAPQVCGTRIAAGGSTARQSDPSHTNREPVPALHEPSYKPGLIQIFHMTAIFDEALSIFKHAPT